MSWDVLFQDLPDDVHSLDDIPDDFRPTRSLGSRASLIAKIRAVVPEVDFSDPAWGVLGGEGFSIELNVGTDDPVDALMLHIRGVDEERVFGILRDLSVALDRRAIDCSSGQLLDFDNADVAAGFRGWRRYRDKIVGKPD